jgi:hypothetical protein
MYIGFRVAYGDLEAWMKALAEADGDVFGAESRAFGAGGVRLRLQRAVRRQVGPLPDEAR